MGSRRQIDGQIDSIGSACLIALYRYVAADGHQLQVRRKKRLALWFFLFCHDPDSPPIPHLDAHAAAKVLDLDRGIRTKVKSLNSRRLLAEAERRRDHYKG